MSTLTPVSPPSAVRLSDLAFERLAASIASGELAAGERLNVDELAARLGISRMPLREALLRLEQVGLIETAASRYTRVTTPTPESVRDAFDYAGVQAGWAARLATARMADDALATAVRLVTADDAAGAPLPEEFLEHVLHHAGSPSLRFALRDARLALARAVRATARPGEEARHRRDELRHLVGEALAARDAEDAERLVRELHGLYPS